MKYILDPVEFWCYLGAFIALLIFLTSLASAQTHGGDNRRGGDPPPPPTGGPRASLFLCIK